MVGNRAKLVTAWLTDFALGLVLRLAGLLPYRWRVALFGWLMARIVAPLTKMPARIRDNLKHVMPDLSAQERERLVAAVPNNLGRQLIELLSPHDLLAVAAQTPFEGDGLAALAAAKTAGQPVILVSGHFGNYDIIRGGLIAQGYDVGGLYRPMNNRFFNERYLRAIRTTGEPLFPRGRSGLAAMVKHLRDGKVLALLIDQHMHRGAPLTFFGKRAYTALSAAQMARKYGALLLPVYAIRQPDGVSFRAVIEAPIAHTSDEEMTQALNDSLEARIRTNMEQWLWTHRRWKGSGYVEGDT